MDESESRFHAVLTSLLQERQIPAADLRVDADGGNEAATIRARCTDDPLLRPPATARGEKGPWDHRQILVEVSFAISQETDRPVLSVTMTTEVEAGHAHFLPLPKNETVVRVACNWEYDTKSLEPGVCEFRDADRLHYLSVCPPDWLSRFARACADARRIAAQTE